MRCADVRDLMWPFLDGELEVDRNVSVMKHLELCPGCRARSEAEGALRDLVPRATAAPEAPALWLRVLDQACARADAERVEAQRAAAEGAVALQADPAPSRSWAARARAAWRPLLAAACVLIFVGAAAGPELYCVARCPTLGRAAAVHHAGLLDAPRPLEELGLPVEGGLGCRKATPRGVTLVGACVPVVGGEVCAVVRLRCDCDGREVVALRLLRAHVHRWHERTLEDGRRYVVFRRDGVRGVGWLDAEGGLRCFVGDEAVPEGRLVAMAAAARGAGS